MQIEEAVKYARWSRRASLGWGLFCLAVALILPYNRNVQIALVLGGGLSILVWMFGVYMMRQRRKKGSPE